MKGFLHHSKIASIIGLVLFVIFAIVQYGVLQKSWAWESFYKLFLIHMMFSYSLYFANAYAYDLVQQWFRLKWQTPLKVIGIGLAASLIVSFVVGFVLSIASAAIYGYSLDEIQSWIFTENFNDLLERIIWISLTITFVFYFVNYYQQNKQKEIQSKEVVIQQITSSNEALKSQIGPHFLFNSLNVLSGLTDENPQKAQAFIADLSMIYRYVLEQSNKDITTVKNEIDFALNYLKLVQTRFEEALHFDIDEQLKQSDLNIIPLSLQLLLENCIKHNAISKLNPLRISIFKQDNYLVVQNNLQQKKQLEPSTKTGLKNIQSKYLMLGKQQVIIQKTQDNFTVKLPLINNQQIATQQSTNLEYLQAKSRVDEIKSFYSHALVYAIVNITLNSIDFFKDYDFNWAYYSSMFWGIGLAVHALFTFGLYHWHKSWKEKKIQEILNNKHKNS